MEFSTGKIRGLQSTSSDSNVFTILALDHGVSLAQTIQPDFPEKVSYQEMVAVKASLLRHLAPLAGAVLLDPVYGLAAAVPMGALPGSAAMLLAVEDGDYATPKKPARRLTGWDVSKIKWAGAAAVKCFFYYHPDDKDLALLQENFVAELVETCQEYDLPLFAEPLSYDTLTADRPRVVIETARRISRLGIDVLKVEFPIDANIETDEEQWANACQELSEVCQSPWALLSAGVDFETFARQVEVACRCGASGYLVGRAVWKETVKLSSDEQERSLIETAVPRLQKLADIANQFGRPWTDFYPYSSEPPQHGWYESIANTTSNKIYIK